VSWRFSKLGKDKVALIDYCTSSSQLCPSQAVHWVWEYLDLANTRFFSLSTLPTDLFTSRGLINALYIGLLLYTKGLLLWLAIKGGWGLEAGG